MNPKLCLLASFAFAAAGICQERVACSDIEAAAHEGKEAVVTGKVVAIFSSSKGTTFLNFGDRYPRHSFSGIVFARNEAAVGDLKHFEGKEVTVSGLIEMSPDHKPQIVISRANQIKAAASAHTASASVKSPAVVANLAPPPETMPVATTEPALKLKTRPVVAAKSTPVVAPQTLIRVSPTSPSKSALPPAGNARMMLAANWIGAGQGGEMTRKDLAKLFGTAGTASEETEVDPMIEVYPGIPILTPLTEAKKVFHLEGVPSSQSRITTPGLPQASFNSFTFAGVFPGGYTRLHLIADKADQVVSVLLVDENTRSRIANETDATGYHTYNFVTGGAKATQGHVVRHQIAADSELMDVVVVDSLFIDPRDPENTSPLRSSKSSSAGATKPKSGKVLERSRWFVPVPVVNLILRSVVQ